MESETALFEDKKYCSSTPTEMEGIPFNVTGERELSNVKDYGIEVANFLEVQKRKDKIPDIIEGSCKDAGSGANENHETEIPFA